VAICREFPGGHWCVRQSCANQEARSRYGEPVSAQPCDVLGRERHVAAGGARLRRDEGVEAVLAPDAIDAPANAEDASLEIEALRSPGKREQLAQAGPGAECQDEQRRGEATASTGVLGLG
jgi:hypothetical protein